MQANLIELAALAGVTTMTPSEGAGHDDRTDKTICLIFRDMPVIPLDKLIGH
jgi:hypothetical protein